jgi:chorismate synthase
MFRFLTAGESHGPGLVTIIEGLPAGLPLSAEPINEQLRRRQGGYGRGARQKIETDSVEILTGVRFGKTLGSPVTFVIRNRDWENWRERMQIEPLEPGAEPPGAITIPRPGHADYVGMVKYGHGDLRNVLERSSARNTATQVAVGAVARELLRQFDVQIVSHVVRIGSIEAPEVHNISAEEIRERAEASPVRCLDPDCTEKIIALIDDSKRRGDTLGGVFEVVAFGLPVGLGSYVHWDRKIDGRIGQALLSLNAIKGVEIGMGVTNGQPLVVRAAMKPIATLMRQLGSVDLKTGEAKPAFAERSDVCAVPAASVIGEALVAIVLAQAIGEKFGGDSLTEMRRNYEAFTATYSKGAFLAEE